jgi:copper oxidase (laccase) domain-containing protein
MRNFSELGVQVLDEIIYKPGQVYGNEDIAILPSLKIRHGISIGPGSENMLEGSNPTRAINLIESFLQRLKMPPLQTAFLMLPPNPGEPDIVDITEQMVAEAKLESANRTGRATDLRAGAVFTTCPNTPELIKPADCPTPIIYGGREGLPPVLGLYHASRVDLDNRLPERATKYMFDHYGCKPDDVIVGIPPGISPRHYFVRPHDRLNRENWRDHLEDKVVKGEERIYLDLLGNLIDQLVSSGILPKNIQAYGHEVCTYELAATEPPLARSQRFSTATAQPDKNGRCLVAASL